MKRHANLDPMVQAAAVMFEVHMVVPHCAKLSSGHLAIRPMTWHEERGLIQINAAAKAQPQDCPLPLNEAAMQANERLLSRHRTAQNSRWTEVLADRSQVLIRPIRAEDAAAESIFVAAHCPQARRYRFLGQSLQPDSETMERSIDADYLQDFDHSQCLAFAAVIREDGRDKFVGVGHYGTTADGAHCECAVTLLDDWENKDLGATLMKHLIDVAKSRGITHMWSIDSAGHLTSPLLEFPPQAGAT